MTEQVAEHAAQKEIPRISSGVSGLDTIASGGLRAAQSYLLRGGPGTGKTTVGLHFLAATTDTPVSFITLHETPDNIRHNAALMGISLDHVRFLDLSPDASMLLEDKSYTLFSPAEAEGGSMTSQIVEHIKAEKPTRLVIDSLSHLRYLASNTFHFRQQILALQRFLRDHGVTVMMLSECREESDDDIDLQHLADGVIHLRVASDTRYIRISKLRGSDFQQGHHALRISEKGVVVYPQLEARRHRRTFASETISSGVPALDELLHGGIERGTITILTGPTGTGKSTLGVQFMKEAAGRGEASVIYAFEEQPSIMVARCQSLNIPIKQMIETKKLKLRPIEPLLYYPDQFAMEVRKEVEERGATIVMLDSISGYRLAMLGANADQGLSIIERLHALCKYLQNMGCTVILINEQEQVTGNFKATSLGLSYLADNIIFLRYLEVEGRIRRAVGVLKKRMSSFENSLRELELTKYGIKVGPPLTGFQGILSGNPERID